MFKPEQINTGPSETINESRAEIEIEKLISELRDERTRLKNMTDHGSNVGISEMMDVAKNHPAILEFFEKAPDVLEEINIDRLTYLESTFLSGKINEEELRELEENYFIPYFEKIKKVEKV